MPSLPFSIGGSNNQPGKNLDWSILDTLRLVMHWHLSFCIYFIYVNFAGTVLWVGLGQRLWGWFANGGERQRVWSWHTCLKVLFSSNSYFYQFSIVLLENYVSSSFLWSGTPKDRLHKIEVHKHLTSKAAQTHRSVITLTDNQRFQ